MAKKRILKQSIFIACEGKNTEPLYFESIKENQEEEPLYPYSITIYPDKEFDENPKTDAIGLVNVAIERKDDFDELWVVFDKDGYTKHKEAFQLANDNNINIAFSSISFETWILLHFERNEYPYLKSANIIDEKFISNENYIPSYNKSGEFNVMPIIEERFNIAFENTCWLRKRTYSKSSPIYNTNPYTDVDILVKKLLLNEIHYEHLLLGELLSFKDIELSVLLDGINICVYIKNNRNKSLVTNSFQILNSKREAINITNTLIDPGKHIRLQLFTKNADNTVFIVFEKLFLEVDLI